MICFPGASAPGSGRRGGCQAWTQAAGWSEGWTSHGNHLWEGELEKQILSGAFISSFASHPALKMNRCQQKASHPQGKSKRKAMNTSSTQSFLLFYIKQNLCVCVCVCVFQSSMFPLFKSQVWTSVRHSLGASRRAQLLLSVTLMTLVGILWGRLGYLKGICFPLPTV